MPRKIMQVHKFLCDFYQGTKGSGSGYLESAVLSLGATASLHFPTMAFFAGLCAPRWSRRCVFCRNQLNGKQTALVNVFLSSCARKSCGLHLAL